MTGHLLFSGNSGVFSVRGVVLLSEVFACVSRQVNTTKQNWKDSDF